MALSAGGAEGGAAAAPVRGRALIVATGRYTDPRLSRLPSTRVDAQGLDEVLRNPAIGNFRVTACLDLPWQEWRIRIGDFFAGRSGDELLLLYITGHGVKDDRGRLYFAATDTDTGRLLATGIPASFIHEAASPHRRRPVVIILDTCFSGAYARDLLLKAPQAVNFADYYGESTGTAVISASGAIEHALAGDPAGDGQPSLFTRHLIDGLASGEADRDGDGQVSLDDLFKHVSMGVQGDTPSQRPERFYFGLDGDLVIAGNPNPRPGQLPQEVLDYLLDPRPKVQALAAPELERLLSGAAPLALAARQALEQLRQNDSRLVSDAAAAALTRATTRQPAPRPGQRATPSPPVSLPVKAAAVLAAVLAAVGIVGYLSQRPAAPPTGAAPGVSASSADGMQPPALVPKTDLAGQIIQAAHSSSSSAPARLSLQTSATGTHTVAGIPLRAPFVKDPPTARSTFHDCGDCPEMVPVPAGRFMMGSPAGRGGSNEGPQHPVELQSFAIGQYDVTFDNWDACVAAGGCSRRLDDHGWGRGRRPVINVSWNDTQEYMRWLSGRTGHDYRLPTEPEWEYAARAQTPWEYPWGDQIGSNRANCTGCGSQWDGRMSSPVGSFAPNNWGLYDMAGNVWQWTQDCYRDRYDDNGAGKPCYYRVFRGGSFSDPPASLRSAYRRSIAAPVGNAGFRVVRPGL